MINRHFTNNLEAARAWLRMAGLTLDPMQGWVDATPALASQRIGWILEIGTHSKPEWCACIIETKGT